MYESIKHLLDVPKGEDTPQAKLDGSVWLDRKKNLLKTWDKTYSKWKLIFGEKFQIIDHMLEVLPPRDPVPGQLWIYNGVLMYWDGTQWKPIKALEQDGSQFDMSIFDNYFIKSPLWKQGNTVVEDKDITAYQENRRKYLQGKQDYVNDSAYFGGNKEKWKYGDPVPELPKDVFGDLEGYSQFLVPNIRYDRMFKDDLIDFGYEQKSPVAIQYKKKYLLDSVPSMIHLNPGKLSKIRKRLFKVDRDAPWILVPAKNTEYYGFRRGERRGHFLRPESKPDDGGYIVHQNGIYLSYQQCQDYDYVLSITFEFNWLNSTGKMTHKTSQDGVNSFYAMDFSHLQSVFIDGFNLEELSYSRDSKAKTITVSEPIDKMEVQMLNTAKREFGFVRQVDVHNNAVFSVLQEYEQPMVFMNGEAMLDTTEWEYDKDKNLFKVAGGLVNMAWAVIDLKYLDEHQTSFNMFEASGIVQDTDASGDAVIHYTRDIRNPEVVKESYLDENGIAKQKEYSLEPFVLFVDGLCVAQKDLIVDRINKTIKVDFMRAGHGIVEGQQYTLLYDRDKLFQSSTSLFPAMSLGTDNISESLVYLNGGLLCNREAVFLTDSTARTGFVHNEIKCFIDKDEADQIRNQLIDKEKFKNNFKLWDQTVNDHSGNWVDIMPAEAESIMAFCFSYANMPTSVFFDPPTQPEDDVHVYAFKYASDVESTLIIRNLPCQNDDPLNPRYPSYKVEKIAESQYLTEEEKKAAGQAVYFTNCHIPDQFIPGTGSLSVWVNGVRQYDIHEWQDETTKRCGFWFYGSPYNPDNIDHDKYPEGVRGFVTYVIDKPEHGNARSVRSKVLDSRYRMSDHLNVYKTYIDSDPEKLSLYPGRVRVYVNGCRLNEDNFIILDNYTIMLTDKFGEEEYPVFGNKRETLSGGKIELTKFTLDYKGTPVKYHPSVDDEILIEVHVPDGRQENYCHLEKGVVIDFIKKELPLAMLEASDEIMIFIDGLFFGMTDNSGYMRSPLSGRLTILQENAVKGLTIDPLYVYLKTTDGEMLKYKNAHNGLEYKPKQHDLIFEWR